MKSILKIKHSPDCGAVRAVRSGFWKTAWGMTEQTFANKFGNKTPSSRGYILWNVTHCNSTNCKAELWVRADDYYALLPRS